MESNVVVFPVSFAQERLWFLDQLEPNTGSYNIPASVRVRGSLDISIVERAFKEIVKRHEVLRTNFASVDGNPVQVIRPNLILSVNRVDIDQLAKHERENEVLRLARDEAMRPFDLTNGPLIRVALVKLAEQEHVLFLTMHHIVSDGWSVGVLIEEIMSLYQAFSNGRLSPLPDLPVQYADFGQWQRGWLRGDVLAQQLSYWRNQLNGDLPVLELPIDRPRPPMRTYRGKNAAFALRKELSDRINDLGRREGSSLFMVLLTAFKMLLARYTGLEDIIVGTAIANRTRVDIEKLIGFFVNSLVLRTDLSGDPTFIELLARVKEVTLGAYAHQDLPFEMLVEDLQPVRDLSRTPLFQVVFAMQNEPIPTLKLPGVTLSDIVVDTTTAKFDLSLKMTETEGGLRGLVIYNSDLFNDDTIARLIDHFETLLDAVVADPSLRVSNSPILPKEERNLLLYTWNASKRDYPKHKCIHELFEDQVEKTPDSIAIAFENEELTYSVLNQRANQLGRYLKKRGVGQDSVVAIMMDRSPELIISILAILKAGGAYLPIDTQNPANRVLAILNDSNAVALLTHESVIKDISFTRLQKLESATDDIVITDKREQIKDLDVLPFPDRNLVDYRKYNQFIVDGCVKKSISILASRGCPYGCFYCHKIWPKNHVVRTAENVFQEVMLHYNRGYRTFSFIDDIFNLNRKNSENFFNLIIKNKLNVRIQFPSGLRGDILTPDYVDLMSEAGVMHMALALETASPRLQRLINKNIDIQKLKDNLEYICKKHPNIIIDLYTMFGFPTETEEEALMTLDFIKSMHWLHFPLLNALKIFPNTNMATLAVENGVTKEAIERSIDRAFHEVSDTMPFSMNFARQYQANFLKDYFLNRQRLEEVIPIQKKNLTFEEITAKYESYLPGGLAAYPEIATLIGSQGFFSEKVKLDEQDQKSTTSISANTSRDVVLNSEKCFRILLVDVSQHFTGNKDLLGKVVEAPLGLMYLLTYLKQVFKKRIDGKIIKSMIDFDSFDDLQRIIEQYQPQVIGIRSLSFYKNIFHKTVSLIKQWCPNTPIIAGGPYATSEYNSMLSDRNIDVAVLGEGEVTFSELIGKVIENNGKLPGKDILGRIAGIAFASPEQGPTTMRMSRIRDVLMLDKITLQVSREERFGITNVNQSSDLAYVMYTSGSTGMPKGICIPHQAINRLVCNTDYLNLLPTDRVAQVANASFDAATFEIWGPLLSGAQLLMITKDIALTPHEFAEQIREKNISVLFLTTALFNHIAREVPRAFRSVRHLLFGGELVDLRWVREVLENNPPERLLHMYGPTENTTFTSWYEIGNVSKEAVTIPIGRSIANTQIYVLDRNLEPVPIGIPGELYIGGDGLARGYLNRYDQTAEKFIPNPFSDKLGSRMYKTGDLVRYLRDGNLEFLSRIDYQVKVRGFRIELGEIESVLMQHPGVQSAVIIEREFAPGDKRLVAYVVPAVPGAIAQSELRQFLENKLPDYMIPASIEFLESLPLTSSGKVDRRALPSVDQSRPELEEAFVAPRTPIESIVAEVWADILAVKNIGIFDNFFNLGGNSLLATQIISRLREACRIEIPLRILFEAPTVAKLSEQIVQVQLDDMIREKNPQEVALKLKELTALTDEEVKIMLQEKKTM